MGRIVPVTPVVQHQPCCIITVLVGAFSQAWSGFRIANEIHYSFERKRVRVKSTMKIQSNSGQSWHMPPPSWYISRRKRHIKFWRDKPNRCKAINQCCSVPSFTQCLWSSCSEKLTYPTILIYICLFD